MSEHRSQYLNETDELIVLAAREILRRAAENAVCGVFGADKTTAEIVNIGRMQGGLFNAADAIDRALIQLEVNAENYPIEPQSLRVAGTGEAA